MTTPHQPQTEVNAAETTPQNPENYAVFDLQNASAPRFIGVGDQEQAMALLVEAYRSDILDYIPEGDFSNWEREFDYLGSQSANEEAYDIYRRKLDQRYRIVELDHAAVSRGELSHAIIEGDPTLQLTLSRLPEAFTNNPVAAG